MTTITHESGFEIDRIDNYQAQGETQDETAPSSAANGKSLSTILRTFGACAVIASLSLFLIEGWTDGNDLNRYIKLLSLTGLISGAGIFLSFIVKEVKGARVFFGLGLVCAVANFTILGALTYSIIQLDGALIDDYSSMLKWQAVSISTLLPLAIGAIALLSVLTRFSFGVFARSVAGKLSGVFLALNALLLIPVRDPAYISILAIIALFSASKISLNIIKSKELLLTLEAKYALACLFLPGLIIVSRALGLYAVDELLLLTIFSLLYYVLRSMGFSSTVWVEYGAGLVAAGLLSSLIPNQYQELITFAFSIVVFVLTYDQCALKENNDNATKRGIILLSSTLVLVVNLLTVMLFSSVAVASLSVLAMVALLVLIQLLADAAADTKGSQIVALFGIAITALVFIFRLIEMFDVGSWVLFGGLGIALILLASLYERFGATFKLPTTSVEA